ncbi:hypothetical protein [Bacteroides sedimenti]|uniref:Acid-resistance membrane protein n=1 Tax=Bacteroides sedimenti TaxID=2136147 RepID=A0ABN6Z7G6_9BACE
MKKYTSLLFLLGAALVLIGAASYITRWTLSPYVFSAGALIVALVQILLTPYNGNDLIVKRLRRQQILGAIFLVASGVLMFALPHGNEWMLSLTIAAVFELYAAFRMPKTDVE